MFGGPQHPKIEIIRTGREKRKVKTCLNVHRLRADPFAAARPPPISPSIPATCLLSVLFCVDGGSRRAGGRRRGGDCCVCVWSGLGGHPPVKSGEAK